MELTAVEKLSKRIGIDVEKFLRDFTFFFNSDLYERVYQYYAGNTKNPNAESFGFLESLEDTCQSISEKLGFFKRKASNLDDLHLIFSIEEAKNKLATVRKLPFYLRTNVGSQSGYTLDYVLGKNETIEDVVKNVLESDNPKNDWIKLAIVNGVYESGYTTDGGLSVNLIATGNTLQGRLESVLGVQNGANALGVDLSKKIRFIDNDLHKLGNEDTFLQSVRICLNLHKGDNPYFPDLGITEDLVVGRNVSSYNIPIIIRELNALFKQDDTIARFSVKDTRREQDSLVCTIEVMSVIGESETINFGIS